MVTCVECGKRLGFFQYYHPTLGKKSLVCGPCFVQVDESVARWRDFIVSNSFNPETPKVSKELYKAIQRKTHKSLRQITSSYLDYPSTNALIQIGGRTA